MAKNQKKAKSRLKKLNPNIIEGGKADKQYFKAVHLNHELNFLNQKLRDPDRLFRNAKIFSPELSPEEFIKGMIDRREKIRGDLNKLQPKKPLWKSAPLDYTELRPELMYYERDKGFMLNPDILAAALYEERQCPDITIGQVAASDFRHYRWGSSEGTGGTGSAAFWPKNVPVTQAFIAGDTYTGDWTGSTGALFWQYLNDIREVPWPLIDVASSIYDAGVFQFTIPAPECDSTVHWGATGTVRLITDNSLDADEGKFSTNWVVNVSWAGEDFPTSIFRFSFFTDGVYDSTDDNHETITRDTEVWNLSYNVPAGVQSRIYLGCSLGSVACLGTVNTMPAGEGDYFNFGYGITYIIVPVN